MSALRVVIPAAGAGARVGAEIPKQYLSLCGRTVIEWALAPFLQRADLAGIVVVLAENDSIFPTLDVAARVRTVVGGAERAESVLRALQSLEAHEEDWVLVHDAARPCLREDDLARLIDELREDRVGGLLATPVADTLKAADEQGCVGTTVPRAHLWRALTPQMFRYGILLRALQDELAVTDESMAVERLGLAPKLVAGRADNIKITVREDLALAEFILNQRNRT